MTRSHISATRTSGCDKLAERPAVTELRVTASLSSLRVPEAGSQRSGSDRILKCVHARLHSRLLHFGRRGVVVVVVPCLCSAHPPPSGVDLSHVISCDRDRLGTVSGCPAVSHTEMSSASNKVINFTRCARLPSEEIFHPRPSSDD